SFTATDREQFRNLTKVTVNLMARNGPIRHIARIDGQDSSPPDVRESSFSEGRIGRSTCYQCGDPGKRPIVGIDSIRTKKNLLGQCSFPDSGIFAKNGKVFSRPILRGQIVKPVNDTLPTGVQRFPYIENSNWDFSLHQRVSNGNCRDT